MVTEVDGQKYTAYICPRCIAEQHARNDCTLCGSMTWHCQRFAHVSLAHPQIITSMEQQDREIAKQPRLEPPIKKIGTFYDRRN